jgi:ribosome biogenesis GTPase
MWGVVHGTGGGVYRVRFDDGTYVEAALRGRLKRERRTGDKVVIGDRVRVGRTGESWVVEQVDDRTSEIVRRGPGGRTPKVVAANLNRVLVVMAARDPDPSLSLVDRLLVVVEASGMHPVLVMNKVDLDPAGSVVDPLVRLYRGIGYEVLTVSAASGEGMEGFAAEVCGGSSAMVGPSGAGKSSLLNAMDPELDLRIGGLSEKTGRGRHTTVSSRLIPLTCGGFVADTPGFGDVGLWGVAAEDVDACFPEIGGLGHLCRFRGCSHLTEPDCEVREALARGDVAQSRYASYAALRSEAEDPRFEGG